ncbi:Plasmodium vivax Vir protein, putative [Plasmodium vivax]|uniref:Vir protein, putative n=1 Tax=Plasmodium vivax TaxID=5855 RepID=A0A1G4EEC9_PLAVI|nr:Plasmodium vivax Vir protein, putative [Plasmodium vivax]
MKSSSRSKDFSKLFRNSPKELYSEKFYDAMDVNSEDLNNYNETCNEIYVNDHKDKMILICEKYLRFLDKSASWSGVSSFYDISLLLNYWIYDKLSRIYGDNNTDAINLGFGALQGKWSTYDSIIRDRSYYEKCRPDPKKVNHKDWENRKKLHDYFVDFDIIFGQGRVFNNLCEVYYKKIKEMIPVCTYFEEKCSPSGTYSCPDHYSKCKEKNLETALKELPCYHTLKAREVSNLEGDFTDQPPRPAERTQDSADGPSAKSHTHLDSVDSGIQTKVTNSVLGAAPVLLTATMLYRVPGFAGSVEAEQIV